MHEIGWLWVCGPMHYIAIQPPPNPLLEKVGELTPALVVLHGYGTDEHDLLPLAEKIGVGYLVISLQGPIELNNGGHSWYDLAQTPSGIIPDDFSRHQSEDILLAALPRIIADEGGDPQRVVLMGFSQGAAMIYSLLISYNLKNYGITPIASINASGYIPRDVVGMVSEKRFDNFTFFITHGEYDDLVPAQALTEAAELLTAQGAKVTTRMQNCGHGVLPETVEEIQAWLKNLKVT
ncbi:MAG TPA: hypothetical protein VGM92_01395 [Candidatus Kapabacteria bacterium]